MTEISTNERATFAVRNLSVLAYANGFTLWHYSGRSDKIAELMVPGFFSGAADMLATGDHMHVQAADGGAVLRVIIKIGNATTEKLT